MAQEEFSFLRVRLLRRGVSDVWMSSMDCAVLIFTCVHVYTQGLKRLEWNRFEQQKQAHRNKDTQIQRNMGIVVQIMGGGG